MKTIFPKGPVWLLFFASFLAFSLSANAQSVASGQAAAGQTMLLTAEGKVEVSKVSASGWTPAQTNMALVTGDRVRTGLRSRAVVRLANLSDLRINELTTFVVQAPSTPGKTSRIGVEAGSTYFFSRERPSDVEFSTPLSSGAIRGTEFDVAVTDNGHSVVTLIDGALSISNAQGSLDLASGEAATVDAGQPPQKTAVVNALNVIQWCLYYPGVIDVDELGLSDAEQQTLSDSLAAYRNGDLLAAVANYPAGRTPQSDAEKIYFAQLLLAAGQVDEAEAQLSGLSAASPLAGALHEVIAAVKNQPWIRPAPDTLASEWLADSYYQQGHGKLDQALAAARKAAAQAPKFGFAWARVAELEFGFGRITAASVALDQGLQLSPRDAEAVSLKGFLLAARNQTAAARKQFEQAIAIDGGLGDAWLGRGLVRIHSGDITGGRQDLEVAATVEPERAIFRSYLGKAFDDKYDVKHARKEFGLAQKLDPNDPTVWLYDALLDEQENRVNDAVGDLEKSQQLNDNRKVYRSQLLLDQDRAVRGANLANIYNDEGMSDVSVREAVKAVNYDYANYSSHLFLANSFFQLLDPNRINLRYETAYDSEFLVANLLAPVGAGTLSQQISQQEYSRLFEHNGMGLSSDTLYTTHGDWHENLVEYGTYGNTDVAFEQDYSRVNDFRPNSDEQDWNFDFRVKEQVTPKDNVFVDVNLEDARGGNRVQYYDQASAANNPYRFNDQQHPNIIVGLHHEWAPGVDTLLLASRLDDTYDVTNPFIMATLTAKDSGGVIQGVLPFIADEYYVSTLEVYSVEAQQIWQTPQLTSIAGARFQSGQFRTMVDEETFDINVFGLFPSSTIASQNVAVGFERVNLYDYEQWRPLDTLQIIGGIAYDRLVYPQNFRSPPVSENTTDRYRVSPKAGVIWTPLKDTTVRAGFSESLGGASIDQSLQLEPTTIAGFDQAFRSIIPEALAGANAGATFTVYGLSLEQKLPTRTYLAVEADWLRSMVMREDGTFEFNDLGGPFLSGTAERLDYKEWAVTASAHQLLGRDWVLSAIYQLSRAHLNDDFTEISPAVASINNFPQTADLHGTLQTLDLNAICQLSCGFFARGDAIWYHQVTDGFSPAQPVSVFWQANLEAGWRFYHRHAELTFGVLNLTDQEYKLSPVNIYTEAPHARTFFTELKFHF